MVNRELSTEQLSVIEKVQKLLALAGNNPNEHEAAAASAKAMALLEAYNLDMMLVERNSGKTGKREDTKFMGGLYPWQRQLWNAVAELHFCKYWYIKGLSKGQTYQHRVLGRHENVVSTRVMSEYLQQTIERLAREWAGHGSQYFTKSAVSYRDGMAARLVERLQRLRQERLDADERKRREDATRARHPGAAPSTALVLADVVQMEEDLNNDHLYGEGWSAKQRANRARWQAEAQAELDKQAAWELANPVEAAAKKAKEKAEWDAYIKKNANRNSRYTAPRYKGDANAYWQGHDKGNDIGLNQQVGHDPAKRVQ